MQLYEAVPLSFTKGWYESTVGGQKTLQNAVATQIGLDGTNTSRELPIYVSSDYHAPTVAGREPITASFNFLNLNDIGYEASFRITGYNTSASGDSRTYYGYDYARWAMPLSVEGQSSVFTTGSSIYVNSTVSSSTGESLTISFGSDDYSYPTLQGGRTYDMSLYVSGLPDGSRLSSGFPSGAVSYKENNTSSGGWVTATFVANRDINLNATSFWLYPPAGWTGDLQLQSFTLSVNDYDGVEDAIRDQTDDMNQNHQDTMDKIDDVTDFDDTEQGQMSGDVGDVTNSFNEKMGILSFADSIFDQFFGLFETDNKQPGLVLPEFSIEVQNTSYTVWEKQTFDLSKLDGWFSGLMTAVRFATSFLIYAALIMYIQKIFGAIVQDWSDR